MNQLLHLLAALFITEFVVAWLELCPKVPELLPPPDIVSGKDVYYVGKIYQREKPERTDTLCSLINFHEKCEGYIMYIYTLPNKVSFNSIFTYNQNTQKLIYYQKLMKSTQEYREVIAQELIKASYIDGSNGENIEVIEQENISEAEDEPFGLLAMHNSRDYYVFMNCNQKAAWVMYHKSVIINHTMENYSEEIKEKLEEYENKYFKFNELKNISINIPSAMVPETIMDRVYTPIQSLCKNIPALPIPHPEIQENIHSDWYVVRVLPRSEPYPESLPNYCSIFNYRSGCHGIKLLYGKKTLVTEIFEIAFDSESDTLIKTEYSTTDDSFFNVFQLTVHGTFEKIKNKEIKYSYYVTNPRKLLAQEYVSIIADPDMKKYIFNITCDMKYAWLQINKDAVQEQASIEAEVKKRINDDFDYVDWNKMESIPPEIPEEEKTDGEFESIYLVNHRDNQNIPTAWYW